MAKLLRTTQRNSAGPLPSIPYVAGQSVSFQGATIEYSQLELRLTSLDAAQKAYPRTQSFSLFDVL